LTDQHPITPPPELINQWWEEAHQTAKYDEPIGPLVATQAARWGSDQELEACCELVPGLTNYLRAARRPKPPSLKEQSLALLDLIQGNKKAWDISDLDVVRRALEALPDD
jgi:hypothetical protein